MREKVVLISLLSDGNEIIGFKCFSYKFYKVINISNYDIKKFNVLSVNTINYKQLIQSKGKLKGYKTLPIINFRMNELLNRKSYGLKVCFTLIGRIKDSSEIKYLVSTPMGQLSIFDRESILRNVRNNSWYFTNLIQSSNSIKLISGTIPVLLNLDIGKINKIESEYYNIEHKNILYKVKLKDLKEKYKKGANLDEKSLMNLKEYRDRLLYTDFMKRNDFLFREISETFTKEEKENMSSVFYGMTHFNKDIGNVILGSVSPEIQERLKKKKTMIQVSNFVNRDLLKYTLERRNSFKCLLPECDDFFNKIETHLDIEKTNEFIYRLDRYSLCKKCDLAFYIKDSVYLYSNKKSLGFFNPLREDNIYIDSEQLKDIRSINIACHEYMHYLSSSGIYTGFCVEDNNIFQIALTEGVTEILACSLTYMIVVKLLKEGKQVYFNKKSININQIKGIYFLKNLKEFNKEINLDKIPKIVAYKNNVSLISYFMQLLTPKEVMRCYFLNDFKSLEIKIIQKIGKVTYKDIVDLILVDNRIDISDKTFKEIKKELGVYCK